MENIEKSRKILNFRTENIFGDNNQFKRRKRRRKRGIIGRIKYKEDELLNNFKSIREEREKRQITMPNGSTPKIPSKYLPSDWSPDNIKTNEAQTSIGPGLLPDGSFSRTYSNNQNKNLMGNENDDYFGNEFFGGNHQNNWQLKRRKRRQLKILDGQKPWFGEKNIIIF